MKQPLYLFRNSTVKRKDNTLCIETSEKKIDRPIEALSEIYLFGEHTLNTKLLNFLSQNQIPVHVFNYYGFYSGTFFPREIYLSGHVTVQQAAHYLDPERRITIAHQFIDAAASNILSNLGYYKNRGRKIEKQINSIKALKKQLALAPGPMELMGLEGNIRDLYYSAFNSIIKQDYDFEKRVYHPPDNFMNAIISFGNSLVYTTVLSEIYRTQLDPTVSFLHEPGYRRYSLALDLAEIFKPILADRLIFTMLNKGELSENDADQNLNHCYLKDTGRKKFLRKYDERLRKTIKHKTLNKQISYKRLIRLDCYKLVKHIIGEAKYSGFKMWW